MPIQLDTTWKAGSIDDMAEYAEAKIVGFRIGVEKHRSIDILVDAGDTVDGAWVSGKTGRFRIELDDHAAEGETSDYRAFVQANSALLASLRQSLYEAAQAKHPKLAGTIT
jgi:hypothetical protein